jgi:hypothetical protein
MGISTKLYDDGGERLSLAEVERIIDKEFSYGSRVVTKSSRFNQ